MQESQFAGCKLVGLPAVGLESRDAILLSVASGQNRARISPHERSRLFEQI